MAKRYITSPSPKQNSVSTGPVKLPIFVSILGVLACTALAGSSYALGLHQGESKIRAVVPTANTSSSDSAQREAIHAALLIWLQQHGGAVDPLAFSLFDISGEYAAFQVAPVLPNSGAVISFGYARNNGETWEILDLSPDAEPADFYSKNTIPQRLQEDNPSFSSDSTNGD
jgi:hypothetical protein